MCGFYGKGVENSIWGSSGWNPGTDPCNETEGDSAQLRRKRPGGRIMTHIQSLLWTDYHWLKLLVYDMWYVIQEIAQKVNKECCWDIPYRITVGVKCLLIYFGTSSNHWTDSSRSMIHHRGPPLGFQRPRSWRRESISIIWRGGGMNYICSVTRVLWHNVHNHIHVHRTDNKHLRNSRLLVQCKWKRETPKRVYVSTPLSFYKRTLNILYSL